MASLNMPKGFEGQRVYLSQSTKEVYVLGCFGFAFFVSGLVHFERNFLLEYTYSTKCFYFVYFVFYYLSVN